MSANVSEIKNFASPPEQVKVAVANVTILIGFPAQTWVDCLKVLKKEAKMIPLLDPTKVDAQAIA